MISVSSAVCIQTDIKYRASFFLIKSFLFPSHPSNPYLIIIVRTLYRRDRRVGVGKNAQTNFRLIDETRKIGTTAADHFRWRRNYMI